MIEKEGSGWRLARDPSRKYFSYLISGHDFSVELTENEWKILTNTLFDLIDQHTNLKDQLMPEEKVSLEIDRPPCWALIEGDKNAWSLKVIINGDGEIARSVELYWPIPSAQLITSAMRTMWDSSK